MEKDGLGEALWCSQCTLSDFVSSSDLIRLHPLISYDILNRSIESISFIIESISFIIILYPSSWSKRIRWTIGASTLGLGEDGLGARALRRALRQFLEDPIAFRILQHQVRSRCEVTVSLEICDAVFTLIFSHWKPLKLTTSDNWSQTPGDVRQLLEGQ